MNSVRVELQGITKKFESFTAVDDVSLYIKEGSFTTFLGPSGCGKTTTLRLVAGLLQPDAGDILVGGRSQRGIPPNERPSAMVFQDYALFPHMTVFDNVSYGLKCRKVRKSEVETRVRAAMEATGIAEYSDRYPMQLSGGQQQRVAVARCLVIQPDVILMDEPLSNLDAKLRERIRTEVRRLQKQIGITTIYVTHDQQEALAISDMIAVYNEGRVQQYGTPEEVFHEPRNKFVADFLGEANFLEATVLGEEDTTCIVRFGNDRRVTAKKAQGLNIPNDRKAWLMIRPEGIEALPELSDNSIPAVVQEKVFLGSTVRYTLNMDGHQIVALQAKEPDAPYLEGQIGVRFREQWSRVVLD